MSFRQIKSFPGVGVPSAAELEYERLLPSNLPDGLTREAVFKGRRCRSSDKGSRELRPGAQWLYQLTMIVDLQTLGGLWL
jgi:hypothetical protein